MDGPLKLAFRAIFHESKTCSLEPIEDPADENGRLRIYVVFTEMRETLAALREEKYDMLLLDLNMSGMDGVETCRAVRSGSDFAIVMLTFRDAEKDKIFALYAGADDYVTKPFSIPELLERVRAALRRLPNPSESCSQVVHAGNLVIDMQTRRVHVGKRAVRLKPKEFDLLCYLASHPNVPIKHAKLLQNVWGPDYGEEVEYLHVFVNQLRKKTEEDPAHPQHILAEPRVGYRFTVPPETYIPPVSR